MKVFDTVADIFKQMLIVVLIVQNYGLSWQSLSLAEIPSHGCVE